MKIGNIFNRKHKEYTMAKRFATDKKTDFKDLYNVSHSVDGQIIISKHRRYEDAQDKYVFKNERETLKFLSDEWDRQWNGLEDALDKAKQDMLGWFKKDLGNT